MLANATDDWRGGRREAAKAEIVRVAKQLAGEHGLAGFSLRDLARGLGMAAPSLYGYFDSKMALYDAMFAAGYQEMLQLDLPPQPEVRAQLRQLAHAHVAFCIDDPIRAQLLFQHTVPGFEPSEESWALARQVYDRRVGSLLAFDGVIQDDLDLYTALVTGIVSQQMSNDPGGDRWVRLLDEAVDLLATRIESRQTQHPTRREGVRR